MLRRYRGNCRYNRSIAKNTFATFLQIIGNFGMRKRKLKACIQEGVLVVQTRQGNFS